MALDPDSSTAVDAPEPAPIGSPDEPSGSSRSLLVRWRLSPWDAGVLVVAGLLVLLFSPNLMFPAWTPRAALLLGVAPVGLLLLARDRSRAVWLAWAVIAWSLLSAALTSEPRSALLGFAGRDLSALTVIFSFGFWAFGRRASERGRALLPEVLAWTIAANALVGLLQVVFDVQEGSLALASGRPTSFMSNPVYFGAVCSLGLVVSVAVHARRPDLRLVVPLVLSGIGTSLSGSRVALIAAVVALVAFVLVHRSRAASVAAALGGVAVVVGVAIDRIAGAGRNAADRLVEGTGGGRVEAWRYGVEAWLDRPLTGYGLGRFRPAVQDRFTTDFVRDHARDEISQAWFDAHNVVIGMLVAVGIIGLLLMAAWAGFAAARVSGPLAWALVPLVLHWMLQPVSLYTLPLAMLVVAVAAPLPESSPAVSRNWIAAAVAVGVFFGGYLLVADVRLRTAADAGDPEAAASAAAMLGADPIARDIVAQLHAFERQEDSLERVIEWRYRVAEAEPDRPFWWSVLAMQLIEAERFDEADEALAEAVELQPNNTRTWTTIGRLAIERNDAPTLQEALDVLCLMGQEECGLDAELLLEQRERGEQPPDDE